MWFPSPPPGVSPCAPRARLAESPPILTTLLQHTEFCTGPIVQADHVCNGILRKIGREERTLEFLQSWVPVYHAIGKRREAETERERERWGGTGGRGVPSPHKQRMRAS